MPQPNRPATSPDDARRQIDTLFSTLSNDISSLETASPSPSFQSTENITNGNNVQHLGNFLGNFAYHKRKLAFPSGFPVSENTSLYT